MNPLLEDVRRNPRLWMRVFVPVMLAAARLEPEARTLLFVLFVTPVRVTNGGRSTWFVGVLVLMVCVIFAMTLHLLPPQAR